MRLGEILQNLRKNNNIFQKEIAEYLGINRVTYTNYELGKREPDYETLIKIADFYNVSLDLIFGRDINKLENFNSKVESAYKSDLHKELITMINYFNKDDLLMIKGYMMKLNERYNISSFKEQIG